MGMFGTIQRKLFSEIEKGLSPTEVHVSLTVARKMLMETDIELWEARRLVLLADEQLTDYFNKGAPHEVYGLKLIVSSDSTDIMVI